MDEEAIKLIATIAALKLLVGRLYSVVYKLAGLKPEQIEQMHKAMRESLTKESLVRTNDAAISDVVSAEVEAEIRQILKGIEQEMGMAQK